MQETDTVTHSDFSAEWWTWLIATGVSLACTAGSKINGILIFFTIGAAVLVDLWDLLDIKKGHSMVSNFLFGTCNCPNFFLSGILHPTFHR